MGLLLLFNDQVVASTDPEMPAVSVLLETTPGVMVDLAADMERVGTRRGRSRELDRFQAGTCDVDLLDTARKYDPGNAASPYAGNLKPMRGLQVKATWAGVTYPLFTGYVDSLEHRYEGGPAGNATCTIRATDGFKVLAAADLASSAYAAEVAADSPVAWYRMGDAASSGALRDSVGRFDLDAFNGTPELGVPGLVAREPDTAMSLAATTGGAQGAGDLPVTSAPCTVEVVMRTATADIPNIAALVTYVLGTGVAMRTDGAGHLQLDAASTPGVAGSAVSTVVVTDGVTHHLAGVWDAGGSLRVYVDGVDVTSAPVSVAVAAFNQPRGVVGVAGVVTPLFFSAGLVGTLDELAFYATALPAARVAAHASCVATPWDGDTPAARLGRVLDLAGWPAALRDLDVGSSVLQSAQLATSVLDHAQKVADSDFGVLYVTAAGSVRLAGRAGMWNQPQLATFGDGGGGELGYRSMQPEYTDALVRNHVTVSRVEGVAQTVTDDASVGEFLRHSYTADGLLHDSDSLSRAAAEFLVSEYKQPLRRISGLLITPRGAPAGLFPQALGRELADQITVVDRPPGGGAANTQDVAVEGIRHTITPKWWETSWDLAPSFGTAGEPGVVGVWDETNWDESRWAF